MNRRSLLKAADFKLDTTPMQPMSLFQWLLLQLGQTATTYPKTCSVCGMSSRGNRITGYFLPCNGEHYHVGGGTTELNWWFKWNGKDHL